MVRVRLRYSKTGTICFASHKDTIRIFRQCFAAAGLPLCYSQGFNPHPRLSFGPSLRTGWAGLDEYMDVMLERSVDNIAGECNPRLPGGLRIIAATVVDGAAPKLAADIEAARYEVTLPGDVVYGRGDQDKNGRAERLRRFETELIERFSDGESEMTGNPAPPRLIEASVSEENDEVRIQYLSTMRGGRSLFPEDLVTPYWGHPDSFEHPIKVVRKALYVRRGGQLRSPISKGVVRSP